MSLRDCGIAGGFKSLRGGRILLFYKSKKVAKNFLDYVFAESRVDSVSLWILRWILQIRRIRIKNIKWMVALFGGLESSKKEGLYFWQKPKVAKTFTRFVRDSGNLYFACEILRFYRICGGFCEFVDSAELWSRWLFEVGKGEKILLLAKAKSSKSFYALRARFWEFVFCV